MSERAAVILAAGRGTRMRSATSKVLHAVGGRAMLEWAIAAARAAGCGRLVVVHAADADDVVACAQGLGCQTAVQDPPLGTGHAVLSAKSVLGDESADVIVLYADTPLVRAETLEEAFAALHTADVAVLGFRATDPGAYGRLATDGAGDLERIVEAGDATPDELTIDLCNSGVMAVSAGKLWGWLERVGNANAKAEYYLTDVVGLARQDGARAVVVSGEEAEFLGVNARVDLARAEAAFQAVARARAMADGVTLIAPETVFFSHDTRLEQDALVEPFVVFGTDVVVEAGARICAHTHLQGARVRAGASVGPFARLRPGADIGPDAKVGNFVEIKKSKLGAGAKASHLSYIGDTEVGPNANIGAGTITCNYDGYAKHATHIGAGAFIGSNTSLVAPVTIGARAITGAGSVITRDVPDDALAVTRARQREIAEWAISFRRRNGDAA